MIGSPKYRSQSLCTEESRWTVIFIYFQIISNIENGRLNIFAYINKIKNLITF